MIPEIKLCAAQNYASKYVLSYILTGLRQITFVIKTLTLSLETENKLSTTNASDPTMMELDESWEKVIKQITDKNKCTSTSALLDFDELIT